MHTLWVGLANDAILCGSVAASDTVLQIRQGRRLVAGPGLFLEAICDAGGADVGIGIVVTYTHEEFVARDTDALRPYVQAARRVLRMRGILMEGQEVHAYIQSDIVRIPACR
jgi:hypothetical protein